MKFRFVCTICELSFTAKQSLKYHLLMHKGEKPYKCDECGKAYSNKQSMYGHVKAHENMKTEIYKCEECGRVFQSKSVLQKHTLTHTKERPFACSECDSTFASSGRSNILVSNIVPIFIYFSTLVENVRRSQFG